MRFILCFKGYGAGDGAGIVWLTSIDNGWISVNVGICVFGMTILADLTGIDFLFGVQDMFWALSLDFGCAGIKADGINDVGGVAAGKCNIGVAFICGAWSLFTEKPLIPPTPLPEPGFFIISVCSLITSLGS